MHFQIYVSQLISMRDISPDFLLIWLVYLSIKEGQLTGTIWGFIIGLMFDLSTGSFVGLSALTKTISGFAAGYFFGENRAQLTFGSYRFVLIILFVSFIHNTLYFILLTRGSDIGLVSAIFQIGLATSFYTSAVALLPMLVFGRKHLT